MPASTKIRRATPADAPACSRVVYEAFCGIADRHNFPHDFPSLEAVAGLVGAFTSHPAAVGFVAEEEGKIVGCNFLDRRTEIGAIGPMTIDPRCQGRGLGRKLMQAVMDVGRHMRGMRLVQDAFNTVSMSLYTSLGFDAREPLVLMQGKISQPPDTGVVGRPMKDDDLQACATLSRKVHGLERTGELKDAIGMFNPFVLSRDGRIMAYASAPNFWPLNHGVAESVEDLTALFSAASASSAQPLALLLPIRQSQLFRWCLAHGLRVIKPMTLMTMGMYQEPAGPYYTSVLY